VTQAPAPARDERDAAAAARALAELTAAFGNRVVASAAVREQHANTTTWIPNEPPDAAGGVSMGVRAATRSGRNITIPQGCAFPVAVRHLALVRMNRQAKTPRVRGRGRACLGNTSGPFFPPGLLARLPLRAGWPQVAGAVRSPRRVPLLL